MKGQELGSSSVKRRSGLGYRSATKTAARSSGFLRALQHVPMRDMAAIGEKAMKVASVETEPRAALLLVLRQERNKRKAARRLARSDRPHLRIVTTPKLCAAPGCERLPELHGKPMCGPHWYRVPGELRREYLGLSDGSARAGFLARVKAAVAGAVAL